LVYAGDNTERKSAEEVELELDHDVREKKRVQGTVLRIVRDTKLARDIKALYNHKCQVCDIAIPTKNGFYSEGAHIKPLGKPHNGDDSLANLICLCPNHHVMFDKGSFAISYNYDLLGAELGQLTVHAKHKIEKENLDYHREIHGYN
jgi:putative restriction endonuclease